MLGTPIVAAIDGSSTLGAWGLELAVSIASWPENVRGYAHVRAESVARARQDQLQLWQRWESGDVQRNRAVPATSA